MAKTWMLLIFRVDGEIMSIKDMSRISKSLAWTLHDMWSISGASHYLDKEELEQKSNVIVANSIADEINDVVSKIYTRDLYGKDYQL